MTYTEFTFAFVGTALSGIGLVALYRAWSDKNCHMLYVWGGWILIGVSLLAWAVAGGKDRGVALGTIIIILQALGFIAYQAWQDKGPKKPTKPLKARPFKTEHTPIRVRLKSVGTGLWVSLGCGGLSFLVAIAIHESLWQFGFEASNALVSALFLFPIFWAVLTAVSLIYRDWKTKLIIFSALAFLSLAVITLSNGIL